MTRRSEFPPRPDCTYCKGSGIISVSKDPDEITDCVCTDEPIELDGVAEMWRQRWVRMHAKYRAALDENGRLRAALDELNADVEDILSTTGQNGIEVAKSHAIRAQMVSIRRLRSRVRELEGAVNDG